MVKGAAGVSLFVQQWFQLCVGWSFVSIAAGVSGKCRLCEGHDFREGSLGR
jgi:hypothetical protein